MDNLPQLYDSKSVALEIHNPKKGEKAIDLRRKMVLLPEVAQALNDVEKLIFVSSTKTQISEIEDPVLIKKTSIMFSYIALDVGLNKPSEREEWAYICTRWLDILKRYYSGLTLSEVKLAFELASAGELNEYLPKNRDGDPDKSHYQNFSVEYLAKILNAYRSKQSSVISKAYKALPEPSKELTPEQIDRLHNETLLRLKMTFLKYKYYGIPANPIYHMLIFDWLKRVGISPDIIPDQDDKEKAYHRFIVRASNGQGNVHDVRKLKDQGLNSDLLKFTSFEIAREREIFEAFEYMVKENLYIGNYLDFRK